MPSNGSSKSLIPRISDGSIHRRSVRSVGSVRSDLVSWLPWIIAAVIALTDLTDPTVLTAQPPSRAGGRIVKLSQGDTVPVPSVPLVLHRIARSEQGPIDTIMVDARGRFQAQFPSDTTALYLFSVRYQGIEYFSAPIRGNRAEPDTALVLIVADTSSTTPVLGADARQVWTSRAPRSSGVRWT